MVIQQHNLLNTAPSCDAVERFLLGFKAFRKGHVTHVKGKKQLIQDTV